MSFFFSFLYSPVSLQFFSVCYKDILSITTVFPWLWAEYIEMGLMKITPSTREFCNANGPRHGACSFFLQKGAVLLTKPIIQMLRMAEGLMTFSAHDWSRTMLWLVTQRFHFTGLFFFFFASVLDLTSWPERLYCPSCASIRTKQVLSRLLSGQCWVQMKILCTLSFPHDTLCTINP